MNFDFALLKKIGQKPRIKTPILISWPKRKTYQVDVETVGVKPLLAQVAGNHVLGLRLATEAK